jgi:membrane dipeptidase
MIRRGWSDADVAKLAGGNVLRVMEQAREGRGKHEERAARDGDDRSAGR